VFSRLAELKDEIEGPRFVFAHILSPHRPYVFGPTYVDEVIGISNRVKTELDEILEESDNPPIIVIQGDHGAPTRPRPISELTDTVARQRLGILNAYHLPGGGNDLLYPSITPVNTFRLILDYYFGATYDLLEDRSYYYDWENVPYEFADVTDIVQQDMILE
jgi:hypothetical protein